MRLNGRVVFACLTLPAVLAACGGGGGGATPPGGATPTPKPSASASSSPKPTSSPLAAYCSNYASFPSASGRVPINITDDAALSNSVLVAYITSTATKTPLYLDNTGNFTSSSPNPLAAGCFSTTAGSKGAVALSVPVNTPGGHIYLVYAPSSGTTLPNPFSGVSTSGPPYGYGKFPDPWDVVEYGTTAGAIVDTTQVSGMGLPLEISVATPLPSGGGASCTPQSTSSIVGVTSCNYANIFNALQGDSDYKPLVVMQPFSGSATPATPIDMQIVAPQDGYSNTTFQWNLLATATLSSSTIASYCPGAPATYGYLSCVLTAYASQPRLFTTNVPGVAPVTGDNYCVGANSTEFILTDIGSGTTCGVSPTPNPSVAQSPNPFHMPIQNFTYGTPPGIGCTTTLLFAEPWGTADVPALFTTNDVFALWKAINLDLNRGAMLTTSQHPVGVNGAQMSDYFTDPMYNTYAYVLHKYFDGNLAYALAYDDAGNFASKLTWNVGDPINIRINAVPNAPTTLPTAAPPNGTLPSPCPALASPGPIGSFNT